MSVSNRRILALAFGVGVVIVVIVRVPHKPSFTVVTMVPPHQYFVDQIGGRYVQSISLLAPSENPFDFELRPDHAYTLLHADIVFLAGFEWEESIVSILKSERIGERSVRVVSLANAETSDLTNGSPFRWMNPKLAQMQVNLIYSTIMTIAPERSQKLQKNYETLSGRISQIDENMDMFRRNQRPQSFLVVCPMFDHLASATDMRQMVLTSLGNTKLDYGELFRQLSTYVVFVQPQCSMDAAISLVEYSDNIPVAEMDALSYDYFANMRYIQEQLWIAVFKPRFKQSRLQMHDLR